VKNPYKKPFRIIPEDYVVPPSSAFYKFTRVPPNANVSIWANIIAFPSLHSHCPLGIMCSRHNNYISKCKSNRPDTRHTDGSILDKIFALSASQQQHCTHFADPVVATNSPTAFFLNLIMFMEVEDANGSRNTITKHTPRGSLRSPRVIMWSYWVSISFWQNELALVWQINPGLIIQNPIMCRSLFSKC
jgi:hypothetical protein